MIYIFCLLHEVKTLRVFIQHIYTMKLNDIGIVQKNDVFQYFSHLGVIVLYFSYIIYS